MNMPATRAVIWDWNGTLLDDVELSIHVVNDILDDHALPRLTRERYLEIFDFPVQRYYERAGMDFNEVDFDALSLHFRRTFEARLDESALFDDVAPTLTTLQTRRVRQLLLSGTEHELLQRMIGRFGIGAAFEEVRGQSDGHARGKLETAAELLERNALDPDTTFFVGDTTHDGEIATALGAQCVLLSTGHHHRQKLEATGWPVVDSLAACIEFLET